jgi:tetratricopeptide (TPR) repeat protein
VLATLGIFHCWQGRYQQATEHHQQALALARDIGERLVQARALGNLAIVADMQGHYQQAVEPMRQALALHRELGDQFGEAITLSNLGTSTSGRAATSRPKATCSRPAPYPAS